MFATERARARAIALGITTLFLLAPTIAQSTARVVNDDKGSRLMVNDLPFMVFGMNWGYMPIGQNYNYSLWTQPDDVIITALNREMPLLKSMGVNVIRQYIGIPPRWVEYIYDNFGIYTMINHPCARYGFTVNGTYIANVDYADPALRDAVKEDVLNQVRMFEGTRGMLLWLLGNENNYGLSWTSFEAEALPGDGDRDVSRARALYSMFGEIIEAIQDVDDRPVAIANGDLGYIDLIAEECKTLDILGSNVYRGISARDLYQVVKDKLGIPVMYTEFGADAFNAKLMQEDQATQARYLIGQWKEIYEMSHGKGKVGNAIGGFVFQWSDGWWKFGQTSNLEIHDTNASWPNAGYPEDYVEGRNNMNEEWWGICAKGFPDDKSLYQVYPRAAYYALQQAFTLDPFAPSTDLVIIGAHFNAIDPVAAEVRARGDRASLLTETVSKFRISSVRMEFETFSTGGTNISTPPSDEPQEALPSFLGFDHMQSFYVDVEAKPSENVVGTVSFNVLGRVPLNPINEIFYENRGRGRTLVDDDGDVVRLEGIERIKVYRAELQWDDSWFRLHGYYRAGHTHWGYEGDFFRLYREAFYGENLDIYNGEAPIGFELEAKRGLQGLKIAFGPEVYWGANPQYVLKYRRRVLGFTTTIMYQDEFAAASEVTTTIAIPVPPFNRATVAIERGFGPFKLEAGAIWAGDTRINEDFQIVEKNPDGTYDVFDDKVNEKDPWGGKARLSFQQGRFNWYGQGAYYGIVATSGPENTQNFTQWLLTDTGLGNGTHALTGLAVQVGKFQIGPNLLYQKPLVGPISSEVPDPATPRNVFDDPFAVRANREMTAGEIVLAYDPTPATWMWQWDNDVREDARLAWSIGYQYRDQPTTRDAGIVILEDGTPVSAGGAPPPHDLWEVRFRLVSALQPTVRFIMGGYGGTGEARNGDDPRLIHRYGANARLTTAAWAFEAWFKLDDWGPYDYHHDFNNTFPVQLFGDISHTLGSPRWFGFPQTRIGVSGLWRSLDDDSNRYVPDAEGNNGTEWEFRTYLHLAL